MPTRRRRTSWTTCSWSCSPGARRRATRRSTSAWRRWRACSTGRWRRSWTRVGRILFERGEEIYNFQGVRRYKDKYDPIWRPRYIAGPNKWAIPVLLADVGLLSSGGMSGLTKRSRPAQPAAAPILPKAA
ncbi:MAG: phosphatidylglycerol lysyltransferase domain-containing protein [Caulobacteraceae bacterium]